MPRGQKTTPEVIYSVMASWAITRNCNETADKLGLAESTVRKLVKENKDKPEYAKLCDDAKDEFSEKATEVIEKAFDRLVEMLDDRERDIPVNQLTNTIGTMYDKRALAKGESTDNTKIEVDINVV